MKHYAVCYQTSYGRCGVVVSAPENRQEYLTFPADKTRIGYVGCASFDEAIIRCRMMERNEANAWGSWEGVMEHWTDLSGERHCLTCEPETNDTQGGTR